MTITEIDDLLHRTTDQIPAAPDWGMYVQPRGDLREGRYRSYYATTVDERTFLISVDVDFTYWVLGLQYAALRDRTVRAMVLEDADEDDVSVLFADGSGICEYLVILDQLLRTDLEVHLMETRL